MNYNRATFEDFGRLKPYKFNLVANGDELNRRIAREAVDAIKAAGRAGRSVLIILPVGPLDYGYWAALCNRESISCKPLVTMNMDEYLNEEDRFINPDHPLSFRGFIQRTFIEQLEPRLRPVPANVKFPDPHDPAATTALIESFGGADLCFGGMGITGHLAFNDPPEPGEPISDLEVRNSRTRCLTISRESATQMALGGVNGNWDILPRRAVTLGMYELLLSKKLHLTFMRSWHSGVLRRALLGPVTGTCPGSFTQEHKNVEVTVTKLAAQLPMCNVAQATGEGYEF
jgi:glucosamine-6-phosphate deaminase